MRKTAELAIADSGLLIETIRYILKLSWPIHLVICCWSRGKNQCLKTRDCSNRLALTSVLHLSSRTVELHTLELSCPPIE